jgi:hypothetical protein
MGMLVNTVLTYLSISLSSLDDISADDSSFLIEIYTSVFTLSSILTPFPPENFCSEWIKSQFIRELLEWRMVDIMASWGEGLLQNVFTPQEMVHWLRKLFQDSPIRAQNIAEILRG